MASNDQRVVVIGSRESELALVQTREVAAALKERLPGSTIEIKTSVAHGDEVLDRTLKELASTDPGLFTKKLEAWLLAKECDVAVHSLKDMPTLLPEGLCLAAVSKREDPRDALVVHPRHKGCGGLAGLPEDAVIGTSSLRRAALVRRRFPRMQLVNIRGNLQTRYRKLVDGDGDTRYDAIILAVAGLSRLGWGDRIEAVLDADEYPYGVGQGALGIECRVDDEQTKALVSCVTHEETYACCVAERAMLRGLQGGCQVPIAASSRVSEGQLHIRGVVLSEDGSKSIEAAHEGDPANALLIGQELASKLMDMGARDIIGDGAPREATYGCAEVRAD